MDFINENYVWLIVVGVVLFMALIGFIAEKTDFGRKEREAKNNKKNNKKEEVVDSVPVFVAPIVSDPAKPNIDELNATSEVVIDETPIVLPTLEPVINEEIGAEPTMLEPINEVSIFDAPVESVFAAEPSNVGEELTEEVTNVELMPEEPVVSDDSVVVEEMSELPISETPGVEEEPVIEETLETIDLSPNLIEEAVIENVSELDQPLPEIDSLANDNNDIEENIWKI